MGEESEAVCRRAGGRTGKGEGERGMEKGRGKGKRRGGSWGAMGVWWRVGGEGMGIEGMR